jgi:hypothetical protein
VSADDPDYVLIETQEDASDLPEASIPYTITMVRLVDQRLINWASGQIPEEAVIYTAQKSSMTGAMQEVQDYCRSQGIAAHELPIKDEHGNSRGMATDHGMQWPEA